MALIDATANALESSVMLKDLASQLSSHGKTFLCAYSGGMDSTVLLHAASKIAGIQLRAIHIHHGLHPDADRWAEHCQAFCIEHNIHLAVIRVHVNLSDGIGTEAAARKARYKAIADYIEKDETLLTAHHLQDQSETVLLRLLRGSGSQGLAAMRTKTCVHGFEQLRPLLAVAKCELQAYAESGKLTWVEDPSNNKIDFDRNYLRHQLMPLLEQRWPQAAANFARSANLLAEENQCLREQSAIYLALLQTVDERSLSAPALMQHSKAWRAQILRAWTESLGAPPLPANILQEIEQSLLTAKPDAAAQVQWSGTEIYRWRDCLYLSDVQNDMPIDWEYHWHDAASFTLPNGDQWAFEGDRKATEIAAGFKLDLGGDLRITLRRGGEKILLKNREHHSTVKNYLQELGIPPWERSRLPLLFSSSGECLAVADILLSARFEAFCDSLSIRFRRSV